MIPSDIRLYTWVDVEEVLLRKQKQNDWPNWLVWARTYWDGLTMGIRPGTQAEAQNWLSEIYDPRFRNKSQSDSLDSYIILESVADNQRILSIFLEETEEAPPTPRLTPSLSRPGVLWPPSENIEPPAIMPLDFPPVVAFHSFKGGVGRTTHAIALAKALTAKKQKVLLVDGDLEAPGISWLFERRLPNPPVSFADFLALVHGDPSPHAETAIQLVSDRLQDAFIDGIFILPSFRSTSGFSSLEIRPEHLIQGSQNAFLLTDILASLGKSLGVDVVLVDLRAGLSELATGLILDPRVYRIFVTTLTGQSIAGTVRVLELIGERSPSTREEDPLPALIFSQVPEDKKLSDLVIEPEQKLLEAARPFLGEDGDILRVITPFADSLLVLPPSWEEVMNKLERSGMVDAVIPLLDWLPSQSGESLQESLSSFKSQRQLIKELAEKLVYAETAEIDNFLATIPLKKLCSDHRRQLPMTVVFGAKGSGKTYTFMQIVRRENWEKFVQETGAEVQNNALIAPVLASKNLEDNAKKIVENVQKKNAKKLKFDRPQYSNDIRDDIRKNLTQNLHEGQWRECWLDVMAWGVGFQPKQAGAGRELADHLFQEKQQLIVVIDGLEDLFQNFDNDENQQKALRALLQEVPEWLGQQPGRPWGIIIFVRRDIVLAAVRQNAAQMMARYQPYALKWNREEALRLVAWVTKKAISNFNINLDKLQDMSEEEITDTLVPLWGKKLGGEKSKDARSVQFVLAALSDFNGQIQSRDLVRFLKIAADKSMNDNRWQDRILIPKAIRDALPECSQRKIEEIEIENTALKNIFTKLRDLAEANRKIPFTREAAQLSIEEIKTLLDNGVLIQEEDDYYMPEIFRYGLNFGLTGRARPRVLSLARRAGQSY